MNILLRRQQIPVLCLCPVPEHCCEHSPTKRGFAVRNQSPIGVTERKNLVGSHVLPSSLARGHLCPTLLWSPKAPAQRSATSTSLQFFCSYCVLYETQVAQRLANGVYTAPTFTKMAPTSRYAGALACALAGPSACASSFPSLSLFQETLLTTAGIDFDADQGLEASSRWTGDRLQAAGADNKRGPHLACAEYGRGREALSILQETVGHGAVRPVSSTRTHGACFMVTVSHTTATALAKYLNLDLSCFGAFPSALKLAPGLLEHSDDCGSTGGGDCSAGRLSTSHGALMRLDSVYGLMVELSPGTSDFDVEQLTLDLNSPSLDLHGINFWSNVGMKGGEHLASAGGAQRGREWSRAATVVHELSESGETSPSDICSWGDLEVRHAANDVVLVSGEFSFVGSLGFF